MTYSIMSCFSQSNSHPNANAQTRSLITDAVVVVASVVGAIFILKGVHAGNIPVISGKIGAYACLVAAVGIPFLDILTLVKQMKQNQKLSQSYKQKPCLAEDDDYRTLLGSQDLLVESLRKQLGKKEKECKLLKTDCNKLKQTVQNCADEKSALAIENDDLKRTIQQIQSPNDSEDNTPDAELQVSELLDAALAENKKLLREISSLNQTVEQKSNNNSHLATQLRETKDSLKKLEDRLNKVYPERDAFKAECKELKEYIQLNSEQP